MKKVLIILLCGIFLFSFNLVTAQQNQGQQGVHDTGTGIDDPDLRESNQGTGQGLEGQDQATEQGQKNDGQTNGGSQLGGELRRGRVESAAHLMIELAESNQGISQQIRNIVQSQVQTQEEAEGALKMAQQRKGFMKFLIGPDYGELKKVEERLDEHNENLEQLKVLREGFDETDAGLFDEQIQVMEEVKQEMENELEESRSGLSLFGWLNRIFNS